LISTGSICVSQSDSCHAACFGCADFCQLMERAPQPFPVSMKIDHELNDIPDKAFYLLCSAVPDTI
jgi:hypothetical protein